MLYFRTDDPAIVAGWAEHVRRDEQVDPTEQPDALQTLRPSYNDDGQDAFVVDDALWLACTAHGPFLDLLEPTTAEAYQEALAAALGELEP